MRVLMAVVKVAVDSPSVVRFIACSGCCSGFFFFFMYFGVVYNFVFFSLFFGLLESMFALSYSSLSW